MVNDKCSHYQCWLLFIYRGLDVFFVFFVFWFIRTFFFQGFSNNDLIIATITSMATWVIMVEIGLYHVCRKGSLWVEISLILSGGIGVVLLLLGVTWVINYTSYFSISMVIWCYILSVMGIIFLHCTLRYLLSLVTNKSINTRKKYVIIGNEELGQSIAKHLFESKISRECLIGFFDNASQPHTQQYCHVLGDIDHAYDYTLDNIVEQVYLALPVYEEGRIQQIIHHLQQVNVSVVFVPDLFLFKLNNPQFSLVGTMPVVTLCETPLIGAWVMVKRLEDIIVSTVILCLIWPLLIIIALAIKVTSRGPIIFSQTRYGLNGERIQVYKFRSMISCEDDTVHIKQVCKGDVRVTSIGSFLRRNSLDELPQFINVLQGHMSIIGPRPHAVAHNEQYRKLIKGYMWRHKVKPGITGWAQVSGWRGETDQLVKMEKRIEHDLEYIRHWSVLFDLKIFFKTIKQFFWNKNVY